MRDTHLATVILLLGAGCSHVDPGLAPRTGAQVRSYDGARIELTATGGFAAFDVRDVVNYDDHSFVHVSRHICSGTCGAPSDSASGTLELTAADSLFGIVQAQNPFTLRNDYGLTPNSADMMIWTLRVTMDGRVKTIRADDETMPPPMQTIVAAVRGTIVAARR